MVGGNRRVQSLTLTVTECNRDLDEASGAADAIACSAGGSFVWDDARARLQVMICVCASPRITRQPVRVKKC